MTLAQILKLCTLNTPVWLIVNGELIETVINRAEFDDSKVVVYTKAKALYWHKIYLDKNLKCNRNTVSIVNENYPLYFSKKAYVDSMIAIREERLKELLEQTSELSEEIDKINNEIAEFRTS